jgi:hypothetical protein
MADQFSQLSSQSSQSSRRLKPSQLRRYDTQRDLTQDHESNVAVAGSSSSFTTPSQAPSSRIVQSDRLPSKKIHSSRRFASTFDISSSRQLFGSPTKPEKRKSDVDDNHNKLMRNEFSVSVSDASQQPLSHSERLPSKKIHSSRRFVSTFDISSSRQLFGSPTKPEKSDVDDNRNKSSASISDVRVLHDASNIAAKAPGRKNYVGNLLKSFKDVESSTDNNRNLFDPPKKVPASNGSLKKAPPQQGQAANTSGFRPASVELHNFPAINAKESLIDALVRGEKIPMTAAELMDKLRKVFNPYFVNPFSRLKKLQVEVPVDVKVLRRLINIINSCGVTGHITSTVMGLPNHSELRFYLGISSRDFWDRFAEHQRLHKSLFGMQLLETTSFGP